MPHLKMDEHLKERTARDSSVGRRPRSRGRIGRVHDGVPAAFPGTRRHCPPRRAVGILEGWKCSPLPVWCPDHVEEGAQSRDQRRKQKVAEKAKRMHRLLAGLHRLEVQDRRLLPLVQATRSASTRPTW